MTYVVLWWLQLFLVAPCPLQNAALAEKFGMKPHYNCPASHGPTTMKVQKQIRVFEDQVAAQAFYDELSLYGCDQYGSKPNQNWQWDCVQKALIGTDFSSNTLPLTVSLPPTVYTEPPIVLASWEPAPEIQVEPPIPISTPTAPVGLMLAYGFNEGSGNSVADASGNMSTGTRSGATWVSGKEANALYFNGSNAFVSAKDANTLDLSSGTIEAWVNLSTSGVWQSVIAKGGSNAYVAQNYSLEIDPDDLVECNLGNGSIYNLALSSTLILPGQFYHLACAWDGNELRTYVNGNLEARTLQTLVPLQNSSQLLIGKFPGNADFFNGMIDEARVYNRALSAPEIRSDMTAPIK